MRLLVIVTSDYGELGTAMYFLHGLQSTQSPVLLLPTSLAHTMAATPGLEVLTYAELADIRRAVVETRPDMAVLASGYLLTTNSGLSLLDLLRLLRTLRRWRVTLLTTDPFLGLLPSPSSLLFRDPRRRDNRSALIGSCVLFPVRYLLRRIWHIYPAPIERLHPQPGARRLCYSSAAAREAPAIAVPDRDQPPTWLFVLSKVDCEMRLRAQGDRFVACVIERLKECVAFGRKALMIGPENLVAAVREHLGDRPEVSVHSETSYARYMHRLMAAEYAFFWNYFSFSVIHRVLANRPVFFFDEGHLPHILPAVGQAGIRLFYDGWRPPLLPMDAPLDERELARREPDMREHFERIADGLRRCPSPHELLQRAASSP